MKYLKLFSLIVAFAFCQLAQAQISPEKRAEIDKMMELTGMNNLFGQMKTQMIEAMKPSMPNVPESFWVSFSNKMNLAELMDVIIPIYDKYYTLEDLRAVNAFYSSPAGKKMISVLPQVMQDCMVAGQAWGQKAGMQAAKEVMAEMKATEK